MEQFRQRMNERIKTQLKATDEEWAVIQPLLENVQTKMRETMMSRFAGMAGAGGPPRRGPAGEAPGASPAADRPERRAQRPVSTESADLRTALENDQTSNTDIKAKLEALRASRKRGEDELAQARADLKKVLSLRQEATLVMMGMLD
jgi:transposase